MFSVAGFLLTARLLQRNRGATVKGLHAINAVLFVLNALLWALVAKQLAFATLWLAVGLGELYVVRKTDLLSS